MPRPTLALTACLWVVMLSGAASLKATSHSTLGSTAAATTTKTLPSIETEQFDILEKTPSNTNGQPQVEIVLPTEHPNLAHHATPAGSSAPQATGVPTVVYRNVAHEDNPQDPAHMTSEKQYELQTESKQKLGLVLAMENEGTDQAVARKGKCTHGRELEHGLCQCDGLWAGPTCSECLLRSEGCKNGGVDKISEENGVCECTDCGEFSGPTCSICDLNKEAECGPLGEEFDLTLCKCVPAGTITVIEECFLDSSFCFHDTTLNKETCKCETCPEHFVGTRCDHCDLPLASNCNNRAQAFKVGTCNCDCDDFFDGVHCESCKIKPVDCLHGDTVDPHTCKCTGCEEGWGGDLCDQCIRESTFCKSDGTLNTNTCMCEGCHPFGGIDCGTCLRGPDFCINGKFNEEKCGCDCAPPHSGPRCGECPLTIDSCKHNSIVSSDDCECIACPTETTGWGGDLCDKCQRDHSFCTHGGHINPLTCECNCDDHYGGPDCNVCKLMPSDCAYRGTVDMDRCVCTECAPFFGDRCERCETSDCGKHGLFDRESCTCKCDEFWAGEQCGSCVRSEHTCLHGGKLDRDTCKCECTEGMWSGPYCETCKLQDKHCKNDAKLAEGLCMCACNHPYTGLLCDVCGMEERECANGAKLNKDTCQCSEGCDTNLYKGRYCDECNVDCENGKATADGCTCECDPGWTGRRCETCALNQEICPPSRGVLHTHDNKCDCQSCENHWGGHFCQVCQLKEEDCKGRGVLAEAPCMCVGCKGDWGGLTCETCELEKKDCGGGTVNKDTCHCECKHPWGGIRCTKCEREQESCRSGKLNPKTCECEGCEPAFWGGPLCNTCEKDPAVACKHGQTGNLNAVLDMITCECTGCVLPWGGEDCQTCQRTKKVCRHGGEINLNSCTCVGCETPWIGEFCHQCDQEFGKQCQNGGTLNVLTCACDCPAGFSGRTCGDCSLTDADCEHGGEVVKGEKCACTNCKGPWEGERCEVCQRNAAFCPNGDFNEVTCSCHCHHPWSGEACQKCNPADLGCKNGRAAEGKELEAMGCMCLCDKHWEGATCEVCQIKSCENDRPLNGNTCSCDCGGFFGGVRCEKVLLQGKCKHGATFENDACSCVYPWTRGLDCSVCGREPASCENGGTLNEADCTCQCKGDWTGAGCAVCKKECVHGKPAAGCSCECEPGWKGALCDQCAKPANFKCNGQGTFDAAKCECACAVSHAGSRFCDACALSDAVCDRGHGFKKHATECSCDCGAGRWGLDNDKLCTVCNLKCANSGTFDAETCTCKCKGGWKGPSCEVCNRAAKLKECPQGTVNDLCECRCAAPWSTDCKTCELKPADCNGAPVNTAKCTCGTCPANQNGDRCEKCTRCQSGTCTKGKCVCSNRQNRAGKACVAAQLKRCDSVGDPHGKTFLGGRWGWHWYFGGEFLLYEDDEWRATMLSRVSGTVAVTSGIGLVQKSTGASVGWERYTSNKMIVNCQEGTATSRDVGGIRVKYLSSGHVEFETTVGKYVRVLLAGSTMHLYVASPHAASDRWDAEGLCGSLKSDGASFRHTRVSPLQPFQDVNKRGWQRPYMEKGKAPFCGLTKGMGQQRHYGGQFDGQTSRTLGVGGQKATTKPAMLEMDEVEAGIQVVANDGDATDNAWLKWDGRAGEEHLQRNQIAIECGMVAITENEQATPVPENDRWDSQAQGVTKSPDGIIYTLITETAFNAVMGKVKSIQSIQSIDADVVGRYKQCVMDADALLGEETGGGMSMGKNLWQPCLEDGGDNCLGDLVPPYNKFASRVQASVLD